MYCPNCGNKIDDENGVLCPTCGCDFRPAKNVFGQWVTYLDTHKIPAENRQQVDRKMNMKILIPAIIIYTIFIGFLLTVVGGGEFAFSTDPLESFKSNLIKNEFEEKEENVFRIKDEITGDYIGFNFNENYFFAENDLMILKLFYFEDRVKWDFSTGYIDYKVVYNIKSGVTECSTVPASYAVNCGIYEGNVREYSIALQNTFNKILDNLNVSTEDLRGDK